MAENHEGQPREMVAAPTEIDPLEEIKPYLRPGTQGAAQAALLRVVSKFHSGPIPPAEELGELERVEKGLAGRVVAMAEKEQANRHSLENKVVDGELGLKGRGQTFALIALFLLLCAVGFLGYLGDTVSAAALGTATIIGVVAVFVTGRHYDKAENVPAENEQPRIQSPSSRPAKRNKRK